MISFDGLNKLIILSSGTTSLSVRDLWSRWVDYICTPGDNSKYYMAMSSLGGNDIDMSQGTKVPIYCFLENGWRIKPQEANHTLNVTDGVLLVYGGGDPFINTTGNYMVRINYQQPVQAISFTIGGSGGNCDPQEVADAVINHSIGNSTLGTAVAKIEKNVDDIQAIIIASS